MVLLVFLVAVVVAFVVGGGVAGSRQVGVD